MFTFTSNFVLESGLKNKNSNKFYVTTSPLSGLMIILFMFLANLMFGQEKANFINLNKSFYGGSKILEDHLGYMWVTNEDGLYKYDGYEFSFIPYQHIFGKGFIGDRHSVIEKDSNNIWISTLNGELTKITNGTIYTSYKENISKKGKPVRISAITTDKEHVWFGSNKGILYNHTKQTEQVDSVLSLPKDLNRNQSIAGIVLTDPDNMWISTSRGKIYHHILNTTILRELKTPFSDFRQNIKTTKDQEGKLWIGTELKGLFVYNPSTDTFSQPFEQESFNGSLKTKMIISLYSDNSGIIWAGTDGDGLFKINPKNNQITNYKHEEYNRLSIGSNTVPFITEDSKGNKWFVLKKGEINILPQQNPNVKYFNSTVNNAPARVLSLLKTKDGSLWIGIDEKGLTRIMPNGRKVQYNNSEKNEFYFKGKYVQSLVEDSKGNLWIGTYQNGLWVYNLDKRTFTRVKTTKETEIPSSDIRCLFKDHKDRIWATMSTAIHVFSKDQDLLAVFGYHENGLSGTISQSVSQDENQNIWVALSNSGLYRLNEDINDLSKSAFIPFEYGPKKNEAYYQYNIKTIYPDYKGGLWLISSSGRLIRFDLRNKSFISYSSTGNLHGLSLTSLLLEDSENIWLGSKNGIHHYNLENHKIRSFYQTDGLQGNVYSRAVFKDSSGVLYFGGDQGVSAFRPSTMEKKDTSAKLYLHSLEILNKSASQIISDQLTNGIEGMKYLELDPGQSSFSFKFSAIDNLLNSNYHYAYRLKGFDKEWIPAKKERLATYTNISHGAYSFEVKAGTSKDTWDIDPISLDIYIKPVWYKSKVAYLIYFILISLLFYGVIVWIRLKNKLEKEEWKNNKEKELYALKMDFFTKMSHEIQTPLTLILGPIDDMLQREGANGNALLRQRLLMLKNNAHRLSRIVTDLITIRNKELNTLRIYASQNNLTVHLKTIALSFSEQARFKNINFHQELPKEDFIIWYDYDKIEHVCYNLISNAFKFSPIGGEITLKIEQSTKDNVTISIKDSGPGIPKEELDLIFELFYQAKLGKHQKGSGIGLALTKELISLHHGKIDVQSSADTGTCFKVTLPTKESTFTEEEKIRVTQKNIVNQELTGEWTPNVKANQIYKVNDKKSHTILIVEDNIDMQIFLKNILEQEYHLLIAENGEQGMAIAERNSPDLIVSDIMMPKMDGINMSEKLQKQKSTGHIPIILMTAENTDNIKIKALNSGAVQFIKKPFDYHELLLKVKNLIISRQKILSKLKMDLVNIPNKNMILSKDEIFMQNLTKEVCENIENPDFKLEELSKLMNMSYSAIYRNCQDITGKTLIEFVRNQRLKKAAILILEQGYNISEASFMSGYKSSKYFTKCFKEEYGISPASLKREAKSIGLETTMKRYKFN
ncbi:response regulator [Arenibacter sp. 6A1]|uniref:two-component regulator propeller domain-containing protein n=1 Tax=Arenibacter sp. 6A1 TaxID=2720391 RepID=UPI001444E550|nr:two-component regulator propeller domain-containing protein [Arenibacter sp. 6A1]NKI27521.1 response regulator [Arenibacter sp. 6A1]